MADDINPPAIPTILQRLGTDEYVPTPLDAAQVAAIHHVVQDGEDSARRVRRDLGDYWSSRLGTAAGLRALNDEHGVTCYVVPEAATFEQAAADETFAGTSGVIDVQTHFMDDLDVMRRMSSELVNVL